MNIIKSSIEYERPVNQFKLWDQSGEWIKKSEWLMDWLTDWLTNLPRLRGTVTLSPDGQALLLSSPTPPAFSTTQPEHVPGPNIHTEMILTLIPKHLTGVMMSNMVNNDNFSTQVSLGVLFWNRKQAGYNCKSNQLLLFSHLSASVSTKPALKWHCE